MVYSIDLLYRGVMDKLASDDAIREVSMKILSLNKHSDRTLYVYEILKKLNVLPEIMTVAKSERLSDKYRDIGNDLFKKRNDYHALQFYNMSLQHAPLGSEQLSLAYSNRSAVFFSLKRYKECLKDIDIVLGMNYPEKIKNKLLNRRQQCRDTDPDEPENNFNENIQKTLKVMKTKNAQYICATSKVEVCNSEQMGRHVIAMDHIAPGEVLAYEEPYACFLVQLKALFACTRCFSFTGNLVPCDTCCVVLFCSHECKDRAVREYHSVECGIGATLAAMEFTKLELLALRVVVKARRERPDWTSLSMAVREADEQPAERLGFVMVDGSYVYDTKHYQSIHSLATNVERRSVSDIFQKAVSAAVLLHLLTSTEFFSEGASSEEEMRECAAGLLLRHMMTSPTNMHSVSATVRAEDGTCITSEEVGSAAYAFLSLINHSCAPNVVRFSKLGTTGTTLVALRPIKKGMQLFDNYGYHHAMQVRAERQTSLKFQYKFDCSCEACVQEWPLHLSMLSSNLPVYLLALNNKLLDSDTIESLKSGNIDTAVKKFRPLCDLANVLEDYVPCLELCECQEAIKQCIFIIHGILPQGYSMAVDWMDLLVKNYIE